MGKVKLIVLITIVSVSLVSLLVFQYILIRKTTAFYDQTFVDVVERVVKDVEQETQEEEIKRIIDETVDFDTDSYVNNIFDPSSRINSKSNRQNISIMRLNQIIVDNHKKQYLQNKNLTDRVLAKLMLENSYKSAAERIDFGKFYERISTALKENTINDNFTFFVSKENNRVIFSNYSINLKNKRRSIKQQIFATPQTDEALYANLIFSSDNSYRNQFINAILPTVIVSIFLFVLVIVTLYVLLVQKRDADIKSDFLNNMTHELKTPIASISLASQMLQDNKMGKSPELLDGVSNVIKAETQRLNLLVDKVLQTSIFESQQILNLREADVNQLISKVVKNFSIKINQTNGRISADLQAENPFALVDNVHFTNVIYNLFENSVKYTTKDLILNVKTWNEKNKLFISIEDNGIGIKKDDQKRIFERFYRVSTGNLHNVKGFGLGLAYVKKIVTEHKGKIEVESEFGIGTKFIIELPLSEPEG